MELPEAIKVCLTKIITVSGRASRSVYWWFFLFYNLAVLVGFIAVMMTIDDNGNGVLVWPFVLGALALTVAMTTAAIRRLHDKNITGWAVLLVIVPFGSLALLVICALPGDPHENSYGPSPVSAEKPEVYAKSNIPHVSDND